ncbi:MFS transporter [Rosettibacter firmus]|uniref:MFS transporter n=1 Tax=Rosettibacter firmus TaxID=3111522 RepID=UPI00336BDAAF
MNLFKKENSETFDLKPKFTIKNTFAALKYPNYKLWFQGQIVSLFGSWMQTTAQAFFIYELTHSPAFLGYVGFASGIPTWLFMLYGGVIADRFPRKNIIIVTQILMMIFAFILAFLTFSKLIQPWHIILLAFLLGVINAFDAPARQAFVNELVEKDALINAIALNSTMFHTAAAIGPAVAGIVYAILGPAWCFTINGISFIAVIYNLLRMKLNAINKKLENKSAPKEFLDGIKYLRTQKLLLLIMLIVAFTSMFGISIVTIFPDWAVKILHGNAATNGFLQTARGIGAVLCALMIASTSKYLIRGKVLSFSMISLPILMILFSFNRTFVISSTLLILIGAAILAINNLSNGLTQTLVTEEFRGRIMGIYSFSFFALMPIGSLLIGTLAEHFGAHLAVMINGVILLILSGIVLYNYPKLIDIE